VKNMSHAKAASSSQPGNAHQTARLTNAAARHVAGPFAPRHFLPDRCGRCSAAIHSLTSGWVAVPWAL
jgi:hypothetical protein